MRNQYQNQKPRGDDNTQTALKTKKTEGLESDSKDPKQAKKIEEKKNALWWLSSEKK